MQFIIPLIAAAAFCFSSLTSAQVATTSNGKVSGRTENGVTSFLGIPYAAPPIGENRWRAPQAVVPWDNVREATTFGSDCSQAIFPPNILPGIQTTPSEDCLYLNVWQPASAKSGSNLPVMVWIHGGGFVNGGGSFPVYSGVNFARDGVVYVSVNYRLNRFGFFAHPALAEEGFGGNFGFYDQIQGLRWVQENIAEFGGDPEQVTIFGESAGGGAMHMLLQSPLARGLFHRVIIQSGGGRAVMPRGDLVRAAALGASFAPGMTAEQLRAMPAAEVDKGINFGRRGPSNYSGPMIDGKTYVGASDYAAADAGLYANVPIMVGANSADAVFVTASDKATVFSQFGDRADEARAVYDPAGTMTALEAAVAVAADMVFVEPARAITRLLAARGHDVWLYRFAHNGTKSGREMGGAPHAAEIPYVFDLEELRLQQFDTGRDADVAALTHRYWVNFAKTGNPNGEGVPAWPKATPDTTKVQFIGTDGTAHIEDPRTPWLDFRATFYVD